MTIGATLEFHGAAGEVTGSCTLVRTEKARILVDFGMFQGSPEDEARNAIAPPIDFASLDAVIVTHAHIDHCGRLAMLPSLGFKGRIYATTATHEPGGRRSARWVCRVVPASTARAVRSIDWSSATLRWETVSKERSDSISSP